MTSKKELQYAYRLAILFFVVGVFCYAAFPKKPPDQPIRKMYASIAGNVLFDHSNDRVYFRTESNPGIKFIDLQKINFACSSPVVVLDMNLATTGNVTNEFIAYTPQGNRDRLNTPAIKQIYAEKIIPSHMFDSVSEYPASTTCKQ